MDLSADELAGIVDLFGALTREELQSAAAELAFKRDGEFEPESFADAVDDAVRSYHLLAVGESAVTGDLATPDDGDDGWLVAGPIAFPQLPADASDLPHILDVHTRKVNRAAVGRAAEQRFRRDAATVAESGDTDRIGELLDVSYELESWAPVDLAEARDRLDVATE